MPSVNIKCCPACGRSVNERQITLFSGMVDALFVVFKFCRKRNRYTFSRREVKHLFKNENETARFADFVLFDSLIYRPAGAKNGFYALDVTRCEAFFSGNLKIPSVVIKNPLTGWMRRENYVYIDEIKNLTEFLTENREYIAVYRTQTSGQMRMF